MTAHREPPTGGEGEHEGPYRVSSLDAEPTFINRVQDFVAVESFDARALTARAWAARLNAAYAAGAKAASDAFAGERKQLQDELTALRQQLEDIARVGL